MKKIIALLCALLLCFGAAGCGGAEEEKENMYISITRQEARSLMDSYAGDCIILDVREQEEYDEAHIPGAVLIPHTQITLRAEKELPDKEQLILVYCRSGRRSKLAAQDLADLGYTNVREFGGIINWPYETE